MGGGRLVGEACLLKRQGAQVTRKVSKPLIPRTRYFFPKSTKLHCFSFTYQSVIPVLRRLNQEGQQFKTSLSNLVRACLKIKMGRAGAMVQWCGVPCAALAEDEPAYFPGCPITIAQLQAESAPLACLNKLVFTHTHTCTLTHTCVHPHIEILCLF